MQSLRLAGLLTCLALVTSSLPPTSEAADFYVDAALGDDARAAIDAQSPVTPWATITRALRAVGPGHRVLVRPGRYAEAPQTQADGVSLIADEPGTVVIAPPAGAVGLSIAGHRDVSVEGIVFEAGARAIRAEGADGLRIRGCTAVGQTSDAITVIGSGRVTIDSSAVLSAGGRGVHLEASGALLLRNNLIYANAAWGVDLDGGATEATRVLAFNTIAYNGTASGGGLRLAAAAELRDSIVAFNARVGLRVVTASCSVHHTDLFGPGSLLVPDTHPLGAGMRSVDPGFVQPAGSDGVLGGIAGYLDDDFSLRQLPGELPPSPLVDAASGPVTSLDISGATASDGTPDGGLADLGFHSGAAAAELGPVAPAEPVPGAAYHVDCASGDDSRTKLDALDASTPWRTLRRAALALSSGEAALVLPGTCAEGVETRVPGVRFLAAEPGTVVLAPPVGITGFNIQHDGTLVEGFLVRSTLQGVLAAKSKAGEILRDVTLRNLTVEPPSGAALATNGIQIRDAEGVTVESSVVRGAQQAGILLKRVSYGYVRNNLVLGQPNDWGISVDGDSPTRFAATLGNVVAFNTVWGNLRGIRLRNSFGEIRDNVVGQNSLSGIKYDQADAALMVHHNDVWQSATAFDLPSGIRPGPSNLQVDPRLLDPAGGRFELRQVAGEEPASPLVDAGSGPLATRDISGSSASDGRPDAGQADMGYHAGADPAGDPPPPPSSVAAPDTFYVDCATGDDARSKAQAANPATPWRTLRRATSLLAEGETLLVLPGLCAEGAETRVPGVSFLAAEPGTAVLAPPTGITGFNVQHDGTLVDGFVIRSPQQGVLAAKSKAGEILRGVTLRGLLVEPPASASLATNGIQVRDADEVTVENSVVRGAQQVGILLKRVQNGYVRNNLLLGHANDWAISVDGDSPGRFAPALGNVVAFNTAWGNLRGIRLRNSFGEIRDNVVSQSALAGIKYEQADAAGAVHHNAVWQSGTAYDLPSGIRAGASNLEVDPGFLDPTSGRFALRQLPGEEPQSPLVDNGSGPVETRDISGSTASDGRADVGRADIGYHAGADATLGAPPPSPPSGPPLPGSGSSYYVDPSSGDDARSTNDARNAASPWRTLSRAVNAARPGDVIHLGAGVYREQADLNADAVTLRGAAPLGAVVISPPVGKSGVYVNGFANVHIENLVVEGAAQGIVARSAPDLRLTGVVVTASASNGIVVEDSPSPWIDSAIVTGSGAMGIKLVRSAPAYVRNNLVYANADWGILLDHTQQGAVLPASTGNVLAFNTLHANRSGIRLLNATAEVRDNNLTGHTDLGLFVGAPGVTIHHNNLSSNRRDRDAQSAFVDSIAAWANLGANPHYLDPAGGDGLLGGLGWMDDDFRIAQLAAGDALDSPSLDAGSGAVGDLDIDGSTAGDGAPDRATADLGHHMNASAARAVPVPMPVGANLQKTYYVDLTRGDDTRSSTEARRAETPWRSIQRALQKVAAGDTILVGPGVYTTDARVETEGVRLIAETAGEVVLRPQGGVALTIVAPRVVVDGFVVEAASTGFSLLPGGDHASIRNCAVVAPGSDGIRAADVTGLSVEGCVVASPGGSGVRLKGVALASVRNCLLYRAAEWGISADANGIASSQVEIAGNTVMGNRSGGVQLHGTGGLVRDNLVTDSGGVGIKINGGSPALEHNGLIRNLAAMDPADYLPRCAARCAGNRTLDPLFENPAGADGLLGGTGWRDDDFRLAEGASGGPRSPAIDAGSDLASALGTTGTTVRSGLPDEGIVDLGFHSAAGPRSLVLPDPSAATRRGAIPADGDWSEIDDVLLLRTVKRARSDPRIPRVGPITADDRVGSALVDAVRPQRSGALLASAGRPGGDGPSRFIDFAVRRLTQSSLTRRLRVSDACSDAVLRIGRPTSLLLAADPAASASPTTAGALLCRDAVRPTSPPTAPLPQIHVAVGPAGAEEFFDVIGLSRVCAPTRLTGDARVRRGDRAGEPVDLPPSAAGDPGQGRACYRVRAVPGPSSADCVLRTNAAAPPPTGALESVLGAEALLEGRVLEICLAANLAEE